MDKLIEKYKELESIVNKLPNDTHRQFLLDSMVALKAELTALESKEQSANFIQVRELTDEEWLAMPKEEILKLYKNCYGMLQQYVKGNYQKAESKSVDQPGTAGVEKKLLDLFGFIDGGVDAENQVKIFKFMDWYKSRSVASDPQPANVREILINYSEFLWGKGAHIGRNFFDSKALSSEKAVDEFLSRSK